jgi:uncharacterized repeat protein (TIGR03803 family)
MIWVNGALYGTTSGGGPADAGTVFTLSPSGQERKLYAFQAGQDGSGPEAPLILASGKLFGTTIYGGGSGCGGNGCGTVFGFKAGPTVQNR